MQNGSQSIPPKPPAPEPGVPALRRKYPNMSDEERLLRHAYAGTQVDDMLAAGPIRTEYTIESPLLKLLEDVLKRPKRARVYIETKGFRLEMKSTTPAEA